MENQMILGFKAEAGFPPINESEKKATSCHPVPTIKLTKTEAQAAKLCEFVPPLTRLNPLLPLSPNVQCKQTPPDVQINNCTQRGFVLLNPLNPRSHTAARSVPWELCLIFNCNGVKKEKKKGKSQSDISFSSTVCLFLFF